MMPSENGFSSSVVGGQDVVVFYDTDVKEAALAWTSYLLSEEAQLMMAQAGVIPTLSSLVATKHSQPTLPPSWSSWKLPRLVYPIRHGQKWIMLSIMPSSVC